MPVTEGYPNELLNLKCLLLRKQYHQCINASFDVLKSSAGDTDKHPFSTFLATFYLALAHDELARSMHEQSTFKPATFSQAEHYYRKALEVLPILETCRGMLEAVSNETMQPILPLLEDHLTPKALSSVQEHPGCGESTEADNLPLESDDDFDDLDNSDTFTVSIPSRSLQRDYSSMSLLDIRPKLNKSTSQGLLRPIRPGSPPKAYHLPPKLPYIGRNNFCESPGAVLPTPPQVLVSSPPTSPKGSPPYGRPPRDLTRLAEHLAGMHSQINTHISLIQRAKLITTVAQAQRASRVASTICSPHPRVPQPKSFWSFKPTNVRLAERQKKIEEGRARAWERKRYRSEKYQALAERALAEL